MKRTLSRRDLIVGSLIAGASFGIPGVRHAAFVLAQEPASKNDLISRELFDATDLALNGGNGFAGQDNESGALGWGGSYVLQAYLLMYRGHRDTKYLDKLVAQFDQFLAQRDTVRKVADYRGLSLPAWRCTSDYTCGSLRLKDVNGIANFEVRTAIRPSTEVAVSIVDGSAPGTFKLIATRNPDKSGDRPIVDVFDDLHPNIDRASRQINARFAELNGTPAGPRTMLTALPASSVGERPANVGPIPIPAAGYVFAVQVGQITYPAAAFARLVLETFSLHDKYKAKALEYREAVVKAIAPFDMDFDEKTSGVGGGWYVWPKGCPNPFDGTELPHNQSLALGRTLIHLGAMPFPSSTSHAYRLRAIKLAVNFKNDLTLGPNDSYVWPYFWSKGWAFRGWKETDEVSEYQPAMVWPRVGGHQVGEDTSHAHLDVDFARLAFENDLGSVFDEIDMKRFANTFTRNILTTNKSGRPTTFAGVDGTGGKGSADTIAAGWVPMAKWDERIYESVKEIYSGRTTPKPDKAVALLMGLAYLNWYARRS